MQVTDIFDYSRIIESQKGNVYLLDMDTNIKATIQLNDDLIVEIFSELTDNELIDIINSM